MFIIGAVLDFSFLFYFVILLHKEIDVITEDEERRSYCVCLW